MLTQAPKGTRDMLPQSMGEFDILSLTDLDEIQDLVESGK